jgi:nucleoside-diphosphate-sugar epimerase
MTAGRKVLVAGGSGLAGRNLVERWLRDGASVLASRTTRPPDEVRDSHRRFDFTRSEDCLAASQDSKLAFLCAARIGGAGGLRDQPTAISYRLVDPRRIEALFGRQRRTAFQEGVHRTACGCKQQQLN